MLIGTPSYDDCLMASCSMKELIPGTDGGHKRQQLSGAAGCSL